MSCKKRISLVFGILSILLLASCGGKEQSNLQIEDMEAEVENVENESENMPIPEEKEKGYLSDLDIEPLYFSFLHGEIQLPNSANEGKEGYNQIISVLANEEYEDNQFEGAKKFFALCDMNKNGTDELIFRMEANKYLLIYILGIQDNELTCYDTFENHTSGISEYEIYENGYILRLLTVEEIFVEYDEKGVGCQKLHFKEYQEGDPKYEYYYESSSEEGAFEPHYLESNEEYEEKLAQYTGNELEWYDCEDFFDIPQKSSDIEK